MTVNISTDYGDVEVTFYANPGQQWGGALVTAHSLQIDGINCIARLYFTRSGEAKRQVGTLPGDDDAYEITVPYEGEEHGFVYLTGAPRDRALIVLAQAFAEATYTPEYCQARRDSKGRELTKILHERDSLNIRLSEILEELRGMEVVGPEFGLGDLPHFFGSPAEHIESLERRDDLREHLSLFALTQQQMQMLEDDAVSREELEQLHHAVCPMVRNR